MDQLNDSLTGVLGPFGPLIAVGLLGLILIFVAISMMMGQRNDPLERLKHDTRLPSNSRQVKQKLRGSQRNEKLERYANFLEPQDEQELQGMKLKLMQAGYRGKDSVRYFHFAQFALGVGALVLGVAYFVLFVQDEQTSMQKTLMYILGPGIVGYMFPKYWVTKRQQTRQGNLTNGFPDSLDMLLVCVEAGQSMEQSIIRVSKEVRPSCADLADELEIVSHEMKAGKDKATVLNDMAERCGSQDISSFVTVMNQSQAFGTPISDALRVYSAEMRDKRVMRAEEAANKLPTKMTLATMMFTVPPLLIILVGPSVHGITQLGNM
ncbi:type II secretion system F family protein [Lentibacter sp. XHP0401]|jgi:tight adherence protein C|uniref:type II secretion system F family protein n=1 Tax=Lentibacter sp. XHP0401 TaxID=2984334 RepID=UPI0021E95EBB|nr:type II secretion system F family protein [Lentibacter sp. XHP0401]MCV2893057.1 type II secretion system F family protein [Lentibacter sp. XHP0401]